MTKLKVFIVDDHPLLRAGLKALVNAQRDMTVVGEAEEGATVADGVVTSGADVVLVDVVMPRMSGALVTEKILEASPNARVLAFSAYEDAPYVKAMLSAGAAGYIAKRAPANELVRAIRAVAAGETYVDPNLPETRRDLKLSRREHAVLKGIARGLALKEIAASLDVSVRSVETYRERALQKTGLVTRADIIKFAAARGWLLDE